MEPKPQARPSADEILLHPKLQPLLKRANLQPSPKPIGKYDAYSPIVEKFKNSLMLTASKSDNNNALSPYGAKTILISPRLLHSASRPNPAAGNFEKKKSDLSKRPYQHYSGLENEDDRDGTCKKKRRKKSSIDSYSSTSP